MSHNYAKHDIVPCQLCSQTFVCLCNRAADCPCAQVNLSPDEAQWIGWQTGGDCICIACLKKMRQDAKTALE
ncbi:Cysteine-rich CWC [Prosthecobacter fusiformis]|uniref:Cysteine-rich CWC n=1 Tax=Prosthecobacter fusiformis TaxID=48464 RepID=A0A4R7S0X2_9BACT|nr:cysteine-rich CWC family protein [Prosthecobacter fusiformis]TDU71106.1 Cysteine-rich CWC [Prosthecobacter fusiformis]